MNEDHPKDSALERMQRNFWTTKQIIIKKFRKKEDDCIIASDFDLDNRIEHLNTSYKLLVDLERVLELYRKHLITLRKTETEFGVFLKECSISDITDAGRAFCNVGELMLSIPKIQKSIRKVLPEFYEEIDTFIRVAMNEMFQAVEVVEKARTSYRGSLMRMKHASKELNPDMPKIVSKFRKVQTQVKLEKQQFESMKYEIMEKINLLLISKSSFLSMNAGKYQNYFCQTSELIASKTKALLALLQKEYPHYMIFRQDDGSKLKVPAIHTNKADNIIPTAIAKECTESLDDCRISGGGCNCTPVDTKTENCRNQSEDNCNFKLKNNLSELQGCVETNKIGSQTVYDLLINFDNEETKESDVNQQTLNYSDELFSIAPDFDEFEKFLDEESCEKKTIFSEPLESREEFAQSSCFLPSQLINSDYWHSMGDSANMNNEAYQNSISELQETTEEHSTNFTDWFLMFKHFESLDSKVNCDSAEMC